MRLLPCLIFVVVAPSAHADDQPPASSVRLKLDAATAARQRAIADIGPLYEGWPEGLPDAEKAARAKGLDERWEATIMPTMEALLVAATNHPDDPASVEALGFVAINARGLTRDLPGRALVALRRDHVRAANVSVATKNAFAHLGRPAAIDLCRAVIAENPSREERGRACNDLAFLDMLAASRIDRSRRQPTLFPPDADLRGADPAALRREAEALYDRCLAEFADVPIIGYGAGRTVGDFARSALVDLRHLQVGMMAPEIAGQDVDGHPLRLVDHRGRVVVLAFSGQWCGPCRANAPILRALLTPEAQAKAPCVVLEVNSDATRAPLRAAIGSGEITWPCWFDGGVTGPISMAWGVVNWPTLYVIDSRGVIRAKDINGTEVSAAVAGVLANHHPARQP